MECEEFPCEKVLAVLKANIGKGFSEGELIKETELTLAKFNEAIVDLLHNDLIYFKGDLIYQVPADTILLLIKANIGMKLSETQLLRYTGLTPEELTQAVKDLVDRNLLYVGEKLIKDAYIFSIPKTT